MATVDPILDYPTPEPPPSERLMLEEGADFVRVIFPVLAEWTYILPTSFLTLTAFLQTISPIYIAYMMWRVIHGQLGGQLPGVNAGFWHWIFMVAWRLWVLAFICWVWAVFAWRRYLRWGRVSRTLLADRQGLTLSYLGLWGMRQKHWPANEIAAIEFRTLRTNLNWRKTVGNLEIRRHKGFPRRFRLSSSDSELPARIANRIRFRLGYALPI